MKKIISTLVIAVFATASVFAEEADTLERNLGRITWSAFECHIYADLKGDIKESERLFLLGYESGQTFLKQVVSGEISDEYLRSNVPWGITMLLRDGGPSEEFILGRIYETAAQEAFDNAVKEDRNGRTLPVDQWRMDGELKKMFAENYYTNSNCELLE